MFGPRSLSRALLAAPFVAEGISTLRSPAKLNAAAQEVGVPIAERFGLAEDPQTLVKMNAGVQVGAGALLALGVLARPASLALAATLVPTTLVAYRFWERHGQERRDQLLQFAKNAGMLGGLLAAALDTGGRPSVFWQARRAAGQASATVGEAAHSVGDVLASAYHAVPGVS